MSHADVAGHFSLVQGGGLYEWARRHHLARTGPATSPRLVLTIVGVAWVPLVLMAAYQALAYGRVDALLRSPSVHARFLVAVPVYFVAESVLDEYCARCLDRLDRGGFLDEPARQRVMVILRRAEALRDSRWAEGLLYAAALLGGQATLWGFADAIGLLEKSSVSTREVGRFWYAVVALPIFQFLLMRTLYRWLIWLRILFGLSRLPLRLVAVHPDRAGGIAFLSEPVYGFAVFVAGSMSVASVSWCGKIVHHEATAKEFGGPIAGLLIVTTLIAFGPLTVFWRQLHREHLRGERAYGHLATESTRLFQEQWLTGAPAGDMLAQPYYQSLSDLSNSYEKIERSRFVPYLARPIFAILASVLVPAIPLILVDVPLPVLFEGTMRILVG